MQSADMDVIKEVPGYKVILKAVLKNQIQQLVGQLSEHTGEDSLLLTASVADGSLSHIGSESGKVFLDTHDDIKTQFLGFCLNRHHRQKQIEKEKEEEREREKERQEREKERQSLLEASNRIMRVPTTPTRFATGMRPRFTPTRLQVSPRQQQFSTRFQTSPRQSGVPPTQGRINSSPHMQPLTGTSPQGAQRVALGNIRHEPYPKARPKKPALNFNQQGNTQNSSSSVPPKQPGTSMRLPTEPQNTKRMNIDPNEVIKIEAPDDDDDVEIVPEKPKLQTNTVAKPQTNIVAKPQTNTIAKQPEVMRTPETVVPKQPVNTLTETAIKIASVSGASETSGESVAKTVPVVSGTPQTSEPPSISGAPTLSVSTVATVHGAPASNVPSNVNMPVLSPIPPDEASNSSESTISNAPISVKVSDLAPPEGLNLASDLSKLTEIQAQNESVKMEQEKSDNASTSSTASTLIAGITQEDDSGIEPTVSVKVEAVNKSGLREDIAGAVTPEQEAQGRGATGVTNMMEMGPGPSTSGAGEMSDGSGNEVNPDYSLLIERYNQASLTSLFGQNAPTEGDLSTVFPTGYPHGVSQIFSSTDGLDNLKSEKEGKTLQFENSSIPPHLIPLYMSKAATSSECKEDSQPATEAVNPENLYQRASMDSDMFDLVDNKPGSVPVPIPRSYTDLERLFLANPEMFGYSPATFQKPRREKPVENRWECQNCGKRLQTKFALDMHMRTHTGEKPYECDFCGMRFNTKGNMKRHKLTHIDSSELNVPQVPKLPNMPEK